MNQIGMKQQIRKISLEQFKSRMPGITPAYLGEELYTFSKDSVYNFPHSNYGMYPCDMGINEKRYTYPRVAEIYHKCEQRERLLKSNTCTKEPYSSLTQYYKWEKSVLTYEECVELESFASQYQTEYDLIKKYVFPRFEIPLEYLEVWNTRYLYFDDVARWIIWFEKRSEYANINKDAITKCNEFEDCCDCEEYVNRGGENMLGKLKEWVDNLNFSAIKYYEDSEIRLTTMIPHTIEDLGEYSLLAEEWKPGYDYTTTNDVSNGASVIFENELYTLNKGDKGFVYNVEKNTFSITSGKTLSSQYIEGYTDLVTSYTYNALNKFIPNPSPETVAIPYDIDTNNGKGYVVIKGGLFPIQNKEYIKCNGLYYLIEYIDINPYVTIEGVVYYGEYNEGKWEFIVGNIKTSISEARDLIEYQGQVFLLSGNKVTISETSYYKVDGYFEYNFNQILIYSGSLTTISNSGLTEPNAESVFGIGSSCWIEDNKCYVLQPYIVYEVNKISSYTESKLSSLESLDRVVYDNLGNKLPGRYKVTDDKIEEIKDGSWLDLMYSPKTAVHVSQTLDENGDVCYWGDYIDSMTFYYLNLKGDVVVSGSTVSEVLEKHKYDMEDYVKCDIVYYMGCDLVRNDNDETYSLSTYKGVKYTDTVTLISKTCSYNVDNYNQYIVNYYELSHEMINYKSTDYGNQELSVPKSIIEFDVTTEMSSTDFIDAPIMMEEYKLGSSSLEKIENNIYINRGTARSFDYHLKLLEVSSLEGLENYGNSWFKIN